MDKPTAAETESEFLRTSFEFILSMQTFFDLSEEEIKRANSTDFDRIEFLLKGAHREVERFSKAFFEDMKKGGHHD